MNIQTLIAEVRRLAKEYPDTVYVRPEGSKSCSYRHGTAAGSCGCLFGQAARNVWPELYGVMERIEEGGRTAPVSLAVQRVLSTHADQLSLVLWCDRCQVRQDGGDTWAKAVAYADIRHAEDAIGA